MVVALSVVVLGLLVYVLQLKRKIKETKKHLRLIKNEYFDMESFVFDNMVFLENGKLPDRRSEHIEKLWNEWHSKNAIVFSTIRRAGEYLDS